MSLQAVTLGVALGEVWHDVREEGGNNRGPRVSMYLANCDPPIHVAAPWCAAAVQAVSDYAAKQLRVPNPLDDVRQEALVMSYHQWAEEGGLLVPADRVIPGDLVMYDFHPGAGNPWDHIGIVVQPPVQSGGFRAAEGNTGSQDQRDGEGFFVKTRDLFAGYTVSFARWGA